MFVMIIWVYNEDWIWFDFDTNLNLKIAYKVKTELNVYTVHCTLYVCNDYYLRIERRLNVIWF